MRDEAKIWIRQAKSDLRNAEKTIGIEAYDVAAFLCHQAVEKVLKGLYVLVEEDEPPKTHTLLHLGQRLKMPEALLTHLRVLTPDYVTSRYPDAANGVPAELYDEPIALDRLKRVREIFEWAGKRADIESA